MATLLEVLRRFEGQSVGPPVEGPDEVNQAMIRHWCDAIGDDDPRYTAVDAVAPPTMLQAWIMPGFRGRKTGGGGLQDELMAMLDVAGFTSVVATNCEQTYPHYLRLGDRVSVSSTIESVSEEKRTGLGVGHFVTSRQTYTDAASEVVGTMLFRILKFAPGTGTPPSVRSDGAPSSPEPTQSEGEELPPLVIPLTRSLIVATAIASRDYQDVHHDPELARVRGSRDIFMNILSSNGFVGRFVTDWAGPDAVLRSVAIRLGAPNYPGDTMTLTGRAVGDQVTVRGANSLGDHVTGTVTLTRPTREH